jgi:hypothetical protein
VPIEIYATIFSTVEKLNRSNTINFIRTTPVRIIATKVSEEIKALHDVGFTGGFMTWNAASSYEKYASLTSAFKKEYGV